MMLWLFKYKLFMINIVRMLTNINFIININHIINTYIKMIVIDL